jgi:16S rRNA (cytosine1402-N4)-methyltransferase
MTESVPHLPVLLEETVSQLVTDPDGIYLDCTVGYGGHATEILKKLNKNGKLIGIDLDPYALEYTQKRLSKTQASYSLYHKNFREYPNLLQKLGIKKLTGILFDLGSSSSQINTGHRGFSFQSDASLDMRFNPEAGISAKQYLNTSDADEIGETIYKYGEERNYRKIAHTICESAERGKMNTTFELKKAVESAVNPRFFTKSLARVFQAVRIKINDELEALKQALTESTNWLKSGGRITVISFHSLEDRIVKHFFRYSALSCVCPSEYPVCICDTVPTLKILTRKALLPREQELQSNSRSRSAKLRVAERS